MKEILLVGISWQNTGKEKSLGADQVDLTGNPRIPHVTWMASPGSSHFPQKKSLQSGIYG